MPIVAARRPRFSNTDAQSLAGQLYGLDAVDIASLPSDRDQNFLLHTEQGAFVLKIANPGELPEVLDFQNQVMMHLKAHNRSIPCPQICPTRTGDIIATVNGAHGARYRVRLVTYLPGVPLAMVNPHTPEMLTDIGRALGRLDQALEDFTHPAMRRDLHWDIQHAPDVIRRHKSHIADPQRRRLVERFLDRFEAHVMPILPDLRTSVIHNDANDHNILIAPLDPKGTGFEPRTVSGIIDFGDMVHTCTVFEPAIACAYVMLDKPDPLAAAGYLLRGYHETYPLTAQELDILFTLIAIRLCTSVSLSAYQRQQEPENDYLSVSEAPAWALLQQLESIHPRQAHYRFRHVCGLPPCPNTPGIVAWLRGHQTEMSSVVSIDLRTEPAMVFDLSVGSLLLGQMADRTNTAPLDHLMSAEMARAEAVVGIGRYNEARQTHTGDEALAGHPGTQEPATLHLGMDLFLPAGTAVLAPLAGVVHSLGTSPDMGPTVILKHEADSVHFYTLYTHLSDASPAELSVGQSIQRGQPIGRIGHGRDRRGLPAHLHFQIATDLMDRGVSFPGLAPPGERDVWLSLCPNPNLILGIPGTTFPKPQRSRTALLRERRQYLGYNLSISYRKPIKVVRGERQYLYDDMGRAYLDVVNNVCHVGHCHPRVVRALYEQAAVLNTNTRYLHDRIIEYAERLTATLPDPLSVCYFVCTGSEANELALRMARTHTGHHDVLVVDAAYHGNTSTLIDISPYKFKGRGGRGEPDYVHTVIMPDGYRGPYKFGEPAVGPRYARHVQEMIGQITASGRSIAAFICESLPGCGGQIVLPDGYLRDAYGYVREAGGVCIADEVQVGFGRVGSHFWGFETQGVVPDIVTMGKPIGNGHPLAAMVTTPEIAASFDNGMEYFNTFGGNPVSCAVGLAVLDVIEAEGLQENARRVGERLLAGLTQLKEKHPIIGDVRGLGLFVGVELVLDRETLEPAGIHASYVAERMRDHGILISTDGPYHNVLKLKPPMVFSEANADRLVSTLDKVLAEDFVALSGRLGGVAGSVETLER